MTSLVSYYWKYVTASSGLLLLLSTTFSRSETLPIEPIRLPALRIDGQPARAHTQGLEISDGQYYVTARREDVLPKRAFLLRAAPARTDWDAWDITPVGPQGVVTALDHPGGMQSDGKRLWIPLAESKRKGRSLIRAFSIEGLVAGHALKSDFEISVEDHIGALAVAIEPKLVFGASWDTETVYIWDFEGRLKRTLAGSELESRRLGGVPGVGGRSGLAVQDWKFVGDRLFASGLLPASVQATGSPRSQLATFAGFLEPRFQRRSIVLPTQANIELAQEAMAITGDVVHFLPEDLGASNRIFRVTVPDLRKLE